MSTLLLPPGPYLLEPVEIGPLRESMGGSPMRYVQFRLWHTDYDQLVAYYVDAPDAKWVWQGMVEHFRDLPNIIGRVFLVEVKLDIHHGDRRNRLMAPMAEVVSTTEHMFEWELRHGWGI